MTAIFVHFSNHHHHLHHHHHHHHHHHVFFPLREIGPYIFLILFWKRSIIFEVQVPSTEWYCLIVHLRETKNLAPKRGRSLCHSTILEKTSYITDWSHDLRGQRLNYRSVAKEISKPSIFAPEVQWALKFAVFVQFTFPLNVSNHAHIWYVTWPQ